VSVNTLHRSQDGYQLPGTREIWCRFAYRQIAGDDIEINTQQETGPFRIRKSRTFSCKED
jgi:hypothetical protein